MFARPVRMLLLAVLAFPAVSMAAGVKFIQGDVKEALSRAQATNRPIMVDVYATWCGPCKELDAKVFQTPEGEKALSEFVALKIDAESGEGPAFVEERRVVGYPTVLFLDSRGTEIDRVFGGMPAADFYRTATDYLAGRNTLADSEKKFASERAGDFELAFEILFRHAARVQEPRALAYLGLIDSARAGLMRSPEPTLGEARKLRQESLDRLSTLAAQGRYVVAKYVYLRGQKQYAMARDKFLELRRDFPKSEFATAALYDLAQAWNGMGNAAKTREALDQYLAANQGEPDAAGAYAWFCFKHGFDTARGVQVAEQALQMNPKQDELWDTLSELYYVRGDKKRALEANAKAIELKPDQPYYQEQRKKFER